MSIYTKNWGSQQIRIACQGRRAYELRPVQLHHKADGAANEAPSFCIVMEIPGNVELYYGQVSLAMLQDAFSRLGYELRKTT